MSKPRLAFAVMVLSLTLPPLFSRCSAQEIPEVDQVADRIAQKFNGKKKVKVVVIDFPFKDGKLTALGQKLGDQLSAALTQRMTANSVVERGQLSARLRASGLSPVDLRDREIAAWLGEETGANTMVVGHLVARDEKFVLSLELDRIGDSNQLLEAGADIPRTDQTIALAEKPIEWPASPEVVVACPSSADSGKTVDLFKAAGVTLPTCSDCPQPEYTDAARSARFQGASKFKVVVDEDGHAISISLRDPAGYGLDVQAMKVIRKWRFRPAIKDGKPVSVCVNVEVTFRFY
jgi:TonB family protein